MGYNIWVWLSATMRLCWYYSIRGKSAEKHKTEEAEMILREWGEGTGMKVELKWTMCSLDSTHFAFLLEQFLFSFVSSLFLSENSGLFNISMKHIKMIFFFLRFTPTHSLATVYDVMRRRRRRRKKGGCEWCLPACYAWCWCSSPWKILYLFCSHITYRRRTFDFFNADVCLSFTFQDIASEHVERTTRQSFAFIKHTRRV